MLLAANTAANFTRILIPARDTNTGVMLILAQKVVQVASFLKEPISIMQRGVLRLTLASGIRIMSGS